MKIQKRSFARYVLLNCLTLGIYGLIVARQMNDEIEALCKGDKQRPAVAHIAAVIMRLIPVFGPIYYDYWWYQQGNRLKQNAGRYDLTVKESGTDLFLLRTIGEIVLIIPNLILFGLTILLPALITALLSLIHPVIAVIFAIIAIIIVAVFGAELSIGAVLSNYYMIKNLNRFADVYRNGGNVFDPMGYEYYPSVSNKYPDMVFAAIKGDSGNNGGGITVVKSEPPIDPPPPPAAGVLVGEKGSCAGYKFDLVAGEEIIIGKDAKVSSIVIDPAYKEISRKHVGVTYDAVHDQYRVKDYSSNGTWVNDVKMANGESRYVPHGTVLKLANGKNIFLLG